MDRSRQGLAYFGAAVWALTLAGLSACATQPPARPPEHWLGRLDAATRVYLSLDPNQHGALWARLPDDLDLSEVLRRAQRLYAGVSWDAPGQPQRFRAVLLGDYPRGLTAFTLNGQKGLSRRAESPEAPEQWVGGSDSLFITLPEDGVMLLATSPWTRAALEPAPPRVRPDQAGAFAAETALIYLPQPGEWVLPPALAGRLGLQEVWLPLSPDPEGWSGQARAVFSDNRQAATAALTLRLVQTFLDQQWPGAREWRPAADGSTLILDNVRLPYSLVLDPLTQLSEAP